LQRPKLDLQRPKLDPQRPKLDLRRPPIDRRPPNLDPQPPQLDPQRLKLDLRREAWPRASSCCITDQYSTAGRAQSRVGFMRTVPPGRSVAVRGYPPPPRGICPARPSSSRQ